MVLRNVRRLVVLVVVLLSSACHMPRPGEVRPEPIAACSAQRIAELEGRYARTSATERELLTYCRTAEAAQALSATQEHVDYMADLQFLGILLSLVSTALIVAVR